jgi:hypothetical protein
MLILVNTDPATILNSSGKNSAKNTAQTQETQNRTLDGLEKSSLLDKTCLFMPSCSMSCNLPMIPPF